MNLGPRVRVSRNRTGETNRKLCRPVEGTAVQPRDAISPRFSTDPVEMSGAPCPDRAGPRVDTAAAHGLDFLAVALSSRG